MPVIASHDGLQYPLCAAFLVPKSLNLCVYLTVYVLSVSSLLTNLDQTALVTCLPIFLSFTNMISNAFVFLFFQVTVNVNL